MKTLSLPGELKSLIIQHCKDRYPHEACGLLIGQGGQVREVIPSSNLSDCPGQNFEIDPALIIKYQKRGRQGRGKIIGHYHSHPDGAAAPSDKDRQQNYDPSLIWLIIQITDAVPRAMKAFAVKAGSLSPIPLNDL